MEGESHEISDNELTELESEAKKEVTDVTPRCYMPIYIPVESPAERITKAKAKLEYNAAMLAKARRDVVPSDKDTDSNGKKDEESDPVNNLTTMVGHMVLESGLTPSMMKLSVGAKSNDVESGLTPFMMKLSVGAKSNDVDIDGSPKPRRERKKSKSKASGEKPDEEGEKTCGDAENSETPTSTTDQQEIGVKAPKKEEEPSEPVQEEVTSTDS